MVRRGIIRVSVLCSFVPDEYAGMYTLKSEFALGQGCVRRRGMSRHSAEADVAVVAHAEVGIVEADHREEEEQGDDADDGESEDNDLHDPAVVEEGQGEHA